MSPKSLFPFFISLLLYCAVFGQVEEKRIIPLNEALTASYFYKFNEGPRLSMDDFIQNFDYSEDNGVENFFSNKPLQLYGIEGDLLYNGIFKEEVFWEGYKGDYDEDWILNAIYQFEDGQEKYSGDFIIRFFNDYPTE